jgi:hypothetical protein
MTTRRWRRLTLVPFTSDGKGGGGGRGKAPARLPKDGDLRLPRFRGRLVYAVNAPLRKTASVSFGVL